MKVQSLEVNSESDLRTLAAAWQDIQQAGGVSHPMYTWEWMSTWWEVFGAGRSLVAFIAREGDAAVAIGAFVLRKARANRLFRFRRLELEGGADLPLNPLVMTFDDGYRDRYAVALPLLQEAGVRADFFVCPWNIENRRLFWWDRITFCLKRAATPKVRLTYPHQMVTLATPALTHGGA